MLALDKEGGPASWPAADPADWETEKPHSQWVIMAGMILF